MSLGADLYCRAGLSLGEQEKEAGTQTVHRGEFGLALCYAQSGCCCFDFRFHEESSLTEWGGEKPHQQGRKE